MDERTLEIYILIEQIKFCFDAVFPNKQSKSCHDAANLSWLTGETFSICCNSYQSNKAIKYQYVQNFLNSKKRAKLCFERGLKLINNNCGFPFSDIRYRHW